jgi:hypothetical protein
MLWLSSEIFVRTSSKFLRSRKHSDTKIQLDDGSIFMVHKFLLARDSPFFKSLFKYGNSNVYKVSKVTKKGFEQILNWMYGHKLKLSLNEALNLLTEADYLCLTELVKIITIFLKKKTKAKHVLMVKEFCLFYNIRNMLKWCQQYINTHFTAVSNEKEFLSLSIQELKNMFLDEALKIEVGEIWKGFVRWTLHDESNRIKVLSEVMETLRLERFGGDFNTMVVPFLWSCQLPRRMVCQIINNILSSQCRNNSGDSPQNKDEEQDDTPGFIANHSTEEIDSDEMEDLQFGISC